MTETKYLELMVEAYFETRLIRPWLNMEGPILDHMKYFLLKVINTSLMVDY